MISWALRWDRPGSEASPARCLSAASYTTIRSSGRCNCGDTGPRSRGAGQSKQGIICKAVSTRLEPGSETEQRRGQDRGYKDEALWGSNLEHVLAPKHHFLKRNEEKPHEIGTEPPED